MRSIIMALGVVLALAGLTACGTVTKVEEIRPPDGINGCDWRAGEWSIIVRDYTTDLAGKETRTAYNYQKCVDQTKARKLIVGGTFTG